MKNKVYFVGAGPGKADLISVRGFNILKEADVVIYDYLIDGQLLACAKKDAELICCDKLANKGKFSNGSSIKLERITDLVIKKAKAGKKVIRLKNGDPSIFGRYRKELEALTKVRIQFEIVPGITAASAASAFSGVPVTDREFASSCVFVTGRENPSKKKSLIDWKVLMNNQTLVLYMAVGTLAYIVKELLKAKKEPNTPIAIIQDVSLPSQRVVTGTLSNIASYAKRQGIKPPAIIIIGEAARFEKRFNWLNKGRRILFTGLSQERFFAKGTYFHVPLIKIEPLSDYKQFDSNLKRIDRFDWIVFASRFGVEYFFKRLRLIGSDVRALKGIKIAAVGASTKNRLFDFGISTDLVPKIESSKGLIERFKKEDLNGKRIFLPRSDLSDKNLENRLKTLGAKISSSFAYTNVIPEYLPDLDLGFFDEIMFTSPSTVRNFKKRYKGLPKGIKVSCIGEVTLKEARRCRLLD